MAKGKVRVVCDIDPKHRRHGVKYEPSYYEIDADLYGDLAVTRSFQIDNDAPVFAKKGWQVSHCTAGQKVTNFDTKAQAVAYCEAFNEIAAGTGAGGDWQPNKALARDYWVPNEAYGQAHKQAILALKDKSTK